MSESKADELVAKALKKLKSFSFFGNKYEDAAELLEKACNQYKLAKVWRKAGETYLKLAEVNVKLDSEHDSASNYVSAANAYKKVSVEDAVRCLEQATSYFVEAGKLSMAARHYKEIGEMYEQAGEKENSLEYYRRAADLYETEESTSAANTCKLKVAQFAAELERYEEAVEIFEAVALASLDSNLLRYGAKGHLLNAGLCRLAQGDAGAVRDALGRYEAMDAGFPDTRECKLLENVVGAMEEGDVDVFQQHVYDYDSMTRLDPWKTSLLLKVKKLVETGGGGEEEDLC